MNTFDACGNADGYIGAIGMWITDNNVARIQDGRGLRLNVQYGTVWITQAGSIKDVFIEAGQSFLMEHDGLTLLSVGDSNPAAVVTLVRSERVDVLRQTTDAFRRLSKAVASVMEHGLRTVLTSPPAMLVARVRPDGVDRAA